MNHLLDLQSWTEHSLKRIFNYEYRLICHDCKILDSIFYVSRKSQPSNLLRCTPLRDANLNWLFQITGPSGDVRYNIGVVPHMDLDSVIIDLVSFLEQGTIHPSWEPKSQLVGILSRLPECFEISTQDNFVVVTPTIHLLDIMNNASVSVLMSGQKVILNWYIEQQNIGSLDRIFDFFNEDKIIDYICKTFGVFDLDNLCKGCGSEAGV